MAEQIQMNDITWEYKLDQVLKNKTTGLITSIKYTFCGSHGEFSHSIPHRKLGVHSDPSSSGFIPVEDVTKEDIYNWIDSAISEVPIFDIEELRVDDYLSEYPEDDPRQPKNQDLSNFRFSSQKEIMEQTILNSINKQILDEENENIFEELTFD